MPRWKLHLLGDHKLVKCGHGPIEMPDAWWPLVACLLAAPGRTLGRGALVGRLWPDKCEHASRHCLASTLWRIRSRLPELDRLVHFHGEQLSLVISKFDWVDVVIFERRATQALLDPRILQLEGPRRRLRSALALYIGDYLCYRESDWVALERERLRTLFLDALFALARAEAEASNWQAARAAARQLCMTEPLREDAQRLLMMAHLRCGSRALAVAQYRALESLLGSELGVTPMMETQLLVEQIKADRSRAIDPVHQFLA